uniref:hypothetical protein n=1 Tax=Photorhabdus sp. RM322S TaxID=3342825 RepID=UPI0036DA5961
MDVNKKMLFEYAFHKETNKIVHVDAVPNGKRCDCVCKNCGDNLIAKNNGKIIQHHFSHTTKEESRDCQMTQLHIAMQLHFSSLSEITLPENEIKIDEELLIASELTTSVTESALEYRVGPYLADVYLTTDAGEVAIEICVTHKCEEEKRQYYIEHQIDSIEYNFPLGEGKSIAEWTSLVRDNFIEYEWIYHSALEKKKLRYQKDLEAKKRNKKIDRKNRSLQSVKKSLSSKKVHLPSIHKEMEYIYTGIPYRESRLIYPKRDVTCDNVYLSLNTDDYAVVEGFIGDRVISVIYSFSDDIPELVYQDDRSIVCRHYTDESNKPTWSWVKHPSITKKFDMIYMQFKADCHSLYRKRQSLIYIKNKAHELASNYVNNRQFYFERDYHGWKRWMIKYKLFTPTLDKRAPSLPEILKRKREYPMLWPFQKWDIMVLSTLAEIIDIHPVGQKIYYLDIFCVLEERFGVSHEYVNILKEFKELNQTTTFDSLINQNSIIQDALSPYAMMSLISIREDHLIRKGDLMLSLSI